MRPRRAAASMRHSIHSLFRFNNKYITYTFTYGICQLGAGRSQVDGIRRMLYLRRNMFCRQIHDSSLYRRAAHGSIHL